MRLVVSEGDLSVAVSTQKLLGRTLGQLAGLQQQVSFLLRSRNGPRMIIGGVELTGVHVLQGRDKPRGASPYHIGGCGLIANESLIRCVGETVERYSQLVAEVCQLHEIMFATYEEIRHGSERVIAQEALSMFSPDQYGRRDFPFHPVGDHPLGWVLSRSLINSHPVWVPAQMALVGYASKSELGEKRIAAAVTTGSAAHRKPELAMRNSLLELIQVDSAIGHWYSASPAYLIEHDARTLAISQIIDQHFHPLGPKVSFYWLPNPDMPGFTVACLIQQAGDRFPRVSVGLGIDLRLSKAMYKAMLEGVGVSGLSKVTLLEACTDPQEDRWIEPQMDLRDMLDLDANVLYFAFPGRSAPIDDRFQPSRSLRAGDLPADMHLDPMDEVRLLTQAFKETEKELVLLDLTTPDIRDLGFTALRVWSPDTLPLSLPSAPPLAHPRFGAYGGVAHDGPHPYA